MMTVYTTKSGDTWDQISFQYYGDEKKAEQLVQANLKYVETIVFSSGVELVIPEIPLETVENDLPPWKRGD